MSNYAASVLAKGQAVVTDKYQAPEQRRQRPTVLGLALKNQEISIPNAQELRKSPLRQVDVNYLTNILPGTATAKAAVHTGTIGDSAAINVVYVQLVETFSLPMKISANNVMSQQALFNNRYEMAWKNLLTRHDNAALAFVLANRAQLAANVMNPQIVQASAGTWNGTNYALEIAGTNRTTFLQKAKAFMNARFLTGRLDVIADIAQMSQFEFQANQGAGNFNNLTFQFNDCNLVETQQQISSMYGAGQALIMPEGALAGLNWNEQLNVIGFDAGDTTTGLLGTINDPMGLGAVADLSYYTQRADTSSNTSGGSTQDLVPQWELALTIGYVLPPLSALGDSVAALVAQVN